MAENKTKQTSASVPDYLDKISDEQKRKDSYTILEIMKKATKEEPKLWGDSIIGFGLVKLKSNASGREVDWFRMGFAPRKANITVYLPLNLKAQKPELDKLGKHKTGGGCLYITRLSDVDLSALKNLINITVKDNFKSYQGATLVK